MSSLPGQHYVEKQKPKTKLVIVLIILKQPKTTTKITKQSIVWCASVWYVCTCWQYSEKYNNKQETTCEICPQSLHILLSFDILMITFFFSFSFSLLPSPSFPPSPPGCCTKLLIRMARM